MSNVTYYTVSNEPYFVGTVALLNSLRLTGNTEDLVVLDCGLNAEQRRCLEEAAVAVDVPADVAESPIFAKPFFAKLATKGVGILIDSDIIVTRPLHDIVRLAEAGSICMYPTSPNDRDRWHSEWHDTLGLTAPLRRERYMNLGFLAVSTERWKDLLERWWEICARVPRDQLFSRAPGPHPFWTGEQDALNALLMSEVPREGLLELPEDEAVFTGDLHRVKIVDADTLECSHRGVRTTCLHYTGRNKPWLARRWPKARVNAYVNLLPRVLFAPDVAVRLQEDSVVPWLRADARGRLLRKLLSVAQVPRRLFRGSAKALVARLPNRLRTRLLVFAGRMEHGR